MNTTAHAPVLSTLAQLYRETPAGRTGEGRGLLVDFEDLLGKSGTKRGDERQASVSILLDAEKANAIELERHVRDSALIERVRIKRERETAFFGYIAGKAPTVERNELAAWFSKASHDTSGVPEIFHSGWQQFLQELAALAETGRTVDPFVRDDMRYNQRLLSAIPALLAWSGESLQRMASCVLFGDSKELARRQKALEACLTRISTGTVSTLAELGITENPRTVLLHGPVHLKLPDGVLDCGLVHGPIAISETDLRRTLSATTTAERLITVENPTSLIELARLKSNDLLIGTSYPGAGTLLLLNLLPANLPSWHFGDSDPAGFDILRDLRERSGRSFESLHMEFRAATETIPLTADEARRARRLLESPALTPQEKRELELTLQNGKGRFEQESLGRPTRRVFPYY